MKNILVLSLMMLAGLTAFSQAFSLNDTTIIFKNKEGKILTKEEVMSVMQQKFTMNSQNLPNGKRSITIIPISESELEQSKKEKDVYRNSFLGKKLPGFSLVDMNDNKLDSNNTKGKIVVLNFWFTACKPCVMEIPELSRLENDYKNNEVIFIAITFDSKESVQQFLVKRSFTYLMVASEKNYPEKLNVTDYPLHIVVDENGIVKNVINGYSDDTIEQLRETIEKILTNKR
jgi:thiol-disulfide isomerase/thioredoxin